MINSTNKKVQPEKTKKDLLSVILTIVIIIAGISAVGLLIRVGFSFVKYKEGNVEYSELQGSFYTATQPETEQQAENGNNIEEPQTETGDDGSEISPVENNLPDIDETQFVKTEFPYTVDYDAMREINDEIVGWIALLDTQLNYPIVQTTNNKWYLNHTFEGKGSFLGAPFLEAACLSDFSGVNSIVYGHNIQNGSMFNSLLNYKKQEFYDEHPVLWLSTPTANYEVDIIACVVTKAVSEPYAVDFATTDEVQSWLDYIMENSVIKTEFEPTVNNHFLTLSTCSYEYYNARTIVVGVMRRVI